MASVLLLLLVATLASVSVVWSTTIAVIDQNGISTTCAQTFYHIDPKTCKSTNMGCPASSKGADPSINEFATNAVSSTSPIVGNGTYTFIDEYWGYIQQIDASGKQVYPPASIPTQHCKATQRNEVYRVHALEYSYSENKLYGVAMVPNNDNQTYDSKVVLLEPSSGECSDVLNNIPGSPEKLPSSCCGKNNRPAFDDSNKIFYYFGASEYSSIPKTSYTVIAANLKSQVFSIGTISKNIHTGYGFMFFDPELGLFALGANGKSYAIYKLQTGWSHFGAITEELVVTLTSKALPSTVAYDDVSHQLYLMYEGLTTVTTLNMQSKISSSCNMAANLAGKIWTWAVLSNA